MFTFHIYPNTISYQVAADQMKQGSEKGIICFPFQLMQLLLVNFTFFISFFKVEKKVNEKSWEWHNYKPQPFPDTKERVDGGGAYRDKGGGDWGKGAGDGE